MSTVSVCPGFHLLRLVEKKKAGEMDNASEKNMVGNLSVMHTI